MGSKRLPGKVLERVCGRALIEVLLSRLVRSGHIETIVLATGDSKENDILTEFVESLGYPVFRGSETDVLDRYYQAAKHYRPAEVVRVTGDCPLIDPTIVDSVIELFRESGADYASNIAPPTFPDGLDVEVFSFEALEIAHRETAICYDREHVTPFFRKDSRFKIVNLTSAEENSKERWTVDYPEDLVVIERILNSFPSSMSFSWEEVMKLKRVSPELFLANERIQREFGLRTGPNSGQRLYKRAKKVIPGGTMLLSKRPEIFLPEVWPSYFSKAKGCRVWDLDGNEYIDMSIMGVGTNILGYGHSEVDRAVKEVIDQGNMSTFNCLEEVVLAERLIELHPWADMVRFARSGGEANAMAIRIARALSGKQRVLFCGYHGWHDWYLSANLGDESRLDGHLLPGLDPKGVPKDLGGTAVPFPYNDLEALERQLMKGEIGTIIMEVSRSESPKAGYLESVRHLATANNITLIFDECTSGFREALGGLHLRYGVEPDMMVLGKALGNGYAITAVVGREETMAVAQDTFMSSTFWTERIGPTAAVKTLEVMEREKSWVSITEIGEKISQGWLELARKYDLPLRLQGLPALKSFSFPVKNHLKYKTLITQEMLKKGFLASNTVYSCVSHSEDIVSNYLDQLDSIFALIAECENGRAVEDLLEVPVCQDGFRRIN